MTHLTRSCAFLVVLCASVAVQAGKTQAPLPPSAVIFSGDFRFQTPSTTFAAAVTAPADGAWLTGTSSYNFMGYPYWDCTHSYTGSLGPNFADYSPLFIAGWTSQGICSDQFPVFGCLNCGVDWGGVKAFPGFYMTTNNTPGFLAPGSGSIVLTTNNGGGGSDVLNLRLVQVNRDAMVNMTMYQSADESDPAPASDQEIAGRTFIANSGDRVPVVPVFHYGVDSNGSDLQYPAGPNVTYVATWETGDTTTPEIGFANQGLHGNTILAVPLPKLTTGNHSFTLSATLPSGKKYTTPKMSVFAYAQTIYLTYGAFNAKTGNDDLPKFLPGVDANGQNVDLRNGPQVMQLNIVTGRATGSVTLTIDPSYYPGIALNYPNPATVDSQGRDPNPDIDLNLGQLTIDVPIPKDHVIRLPLYVRDYGATALISVVVPYRKKTYTATRRIPLDDDKNGLPDAGWSVNGNHIDSTGLTADVDRDQQDANGPGGDGLSAAEEFRGLFQAGGYTRLDPRKRDLFIVADDEFLLNYNIVNEVTNLPFNVHMIDKTDVKGAAGDRDLDTIRPVIDPNRQGIPGARTDGQRAVRLVYQNQNYPFVTVFVPILPGVFQEQAVPAWQTGIFGATILDGISLTQIDRTSGGALVTAFTPRSPDGTQVVELYERTWTNVGLSVDFSTPAYYDDAGNPVVRCGGPDPNAECDDWDLSHLMILPHVQPGGYFVLHSQPGPSDFFSKPAVNCSDLSANGLVVGGLTMAEMQQLHQSTALHEVGHAVHMPHLHTECTDLLFDTEGTYSPRRAMPDITPLATKYSDTDKFFTQLWE